MSISRFLKTCMKEIWLPYTLYGKYFSLRHWNTGLVPSRASLTSWGEGASLALFGHTSSGVTIKMPHGVASCFTSTRFTPLLGWHKTECGFIVKSFETGLGWWMLVVAVISTDAYPFLVFSDLTCHLEDTGIGVFWLHCAAW